MVLSVVRVHRDPSKHTAVEHIEYQLWCDVCNSCEWQLSPNDGRTRNSYAAMERMVTWLFFDFYQLCQKDVNKCAHIITYELYHCKYIYKYEFLLLHAHLCVWLYLASGSTWKQTNSNLSTVSKLSGESPYWNMCGCLLKIGHVSRYQVSQVDVYESSSKNANS